MYLSSDRLFLNLSEYAYDVISRDSALFLARVNHSGIVNRVIENMFDDDEFSFVHRSEKERSKYARALLSSSLSTDHPEVSEIITDIVDTLISHYERDQLQSLKTALLYPKEHCIKPRLNIALKSLLEENDNIEREVDVFFNGSSGEYFKYLIECYSRMPFGERERVFFKKWYDELMNQVSLPLTYRNLIEIEYESSRKVLAKRIVKPYKIIQAQDSGYYYFVGLSRSKEQTRKEYSPASFRLSRIRNIKTISSTYYGSPKISHVEQAKLDDALNKKGPQFLISDYEKIEVSLTPDGLVLYNAMQQLRPNAIKSEILPDGSTFMRFNCSRAQALYYFFKFGASVKILQPEDLKNEFYSRYINAANLYSI